MRIQHNISAMNAYRNFNTNNSKLTKNLEKLSTGYKINRAGDDAAGLAISEKMRAQITGLEGATKNAKDGISLIQTAEGALTEVHDMLNRMVTLSEQSANGTYDDTLDRAQLQKEVDALKSEIDRVADSTNYNGIKLLDGSLSGAGTLQGSVNTTETKALAAKSTTAAITAGTIATENDKISYSMSYTDNAGVQQHKTVEFTLTEDRAYMVASDGTRYATASSVSTGTTQVSMAVGSELQKDKNLSAAFEIETSTAAATISFTSKVAGSKGATLDSVDTAFYNDKTKAVSSMAGNTITRDSKALDSTQKLDFVNLRILTNKNVTDTGDVEKAVKDNTFSIDGKKFVLMGSGEDYDNFKKKVGSDTTIIKLGQAGNNVLADSKYTASAADAKLIAAELTRYTGRNFEAITSDTADTNAGLAENDIVLRNDKLSKGGKELTLQVGDTSDDFNQVGVKVADMHVDALGLTDVDISSQEGAAAAVSVIKNAVNMVSDTRGGLGALQNRLDHTINNLGVMRENIQSAEGLIRDTDVAEEMTTYTKNNILNQAAQAMLAQANQLPQGVLQLLG